MTTTKAPQLSSEIVKKTIKTSEMANPLEWVDSSAKILFSLSQEEVNKLVKAGSLDKYVAQELKRQREQWVERVEAEHKKLTKELGANEYRSGMNFMKATVVSIIKD